jgi:transcriptional regulator with XRE-family HTH domain
MGYRGKVIEQAKARELRAQGWTYDEIARDLTVSKSSVSLWCRDVEVDRAMWAARRDMRAKKWTPRGPNALARRRAEQIEKLYAEARGLLGRLDDREFLVAGAALYAGEGARRDGAVRFTNSDPRIIAFFLAWLRHFFVIDESRLRLRLYLHEHLDLAAANAFWCDVTSIPIAQFGKPHRAVADASIRAVKHPMGCPSVIYNCAQTHRATMGLVTALLSCIVPFRGGEIGITADC